MGEFCTEFWPGASDTLSDTDVDERAVFRAPGSKFVLFSGDGAMLKLDFKNDDGRLLGLVQPKEGVRGGVWVRSVDIDTLGDGSGGVSGPASLACLEWLGIVGMTFPIARESCLLCS